MRWAGRVDTNSVENEPREPGEAVAALSRRGAWFERRRPRHPEVRIAPRRARPSAKQLEKAVEKPLRRAHGSAGRLHVAGDLLHELRLALEHLLVAEPAPQLDDQ